MKSIRAVFEKVREENPDWSDYICFSEAVAHRKFCKDRISRAFTKFVPVEDCPESRGAVLRHLANLSASEGIPYEINQEERLRAAKIKSSDYMQFRNAVLKRDGNTCRVCGTRFPLVVHHVKEFSKSPELRLAVDNGITLCQECHKKVHSKTPPTLEIHLAENLRETTLILPAYTFLHKMV